MKTSEPYNAPPSIPNSVAASFIRDTATLIGAQGLITVVAIGTSVITARALGPEGRGYFGLALLFTAALVTLTDFGMGPAGTRLAATRQWPPRVILSSQALAGLTRIVIVAVIGLAIIAFAHGWLFPGLPTRFLQIGLLLLIPTTIAGFILPLFLGLGRATIYSRLLVLSSYLAFGALGAAWLLFGLDVQKALIAQVAAGVATSTVIWINAIRTAGGLGRPSFGYLSAAYQFGLGIYVSNVSWFAHSRLVVLLINGYVGAEAVGIYFLAQTAADRVYMFADSIGTILLPRIAEDPENNSARLTPIIFRITLLIGGTASVSLAIIAPWFVRVLYTDVFMDAVPTLRLLLVAIVLSSGWRVLSQDLNGRGNSGLTAAVNAGAAGINLALAIVLLPRFGIVGAAWSTIGSSGFAMIAGVWLLNHNRIDRGRLEFLMPSTRERAVARGLLGGLRYVSQMGYRFWWALLRAYVLDDLALRLVLLASPFRRRWIVLIRRLTMPLALRRARSLQVKIAIRQPLTSVLQPEELGFSAVVIASIRKTAYDGEIAVLGEFDHYGRLVSTLPTIDCLTYTTTEQARPRERARVLLVMMPKGVAVLKRYFGNHAKNRFLAELSALERLRGSGARVPEILQIDVDTPELVETFIPGKDLERVLESMGAQLTGEATRERLGGNPSEQEIFDSYIAEGAHFATKLAPGIIEEIHEQLRIIHRNGVEVYDFKYGNVIIHGIPAFRT